MEEDRRNHPRYRLWLPAKLAGSGETTQMAVGHDVSQSGALLVTASKLKVGQKVTLTVQIPPEKGDELTLEASVVRCERNAEDPNSLWPFQVALAFDQPNTKLEELVLEHREIIEGMSDESEQRS